MELERQMLLLMASMLDDARRMGALTDSPEGMRVICLSDTLVRQFSSALRKIAIKLCEGANDPKT